MKFYFTIVLCLNLKVRFLLIQKKNVTLFIFNFIFYCTFIVYSQFISATNSACDSFDQLKSTITTDLENFQREEGIFSWDLVGHVDLLLDYVPTESQQLNERLQFIYNSSILFCDAYDNLTTDSYTLFRYSEDYIKNDDEIRNELENDAAAYNKKEHIDAVCGVVDVLENLVDVHTRRTIQCIKDYKDSFVSYRLKSTEDIPNNTETSDELRANEQSKTSISVETVGQSSKDSSTTATSALEVLPGQSVIDTLSSIDDASSITPNTLLPNVPKHRSPPRIRIRKRLSETESKNVSIDKIYSNLMVFLKKLQDDTTPENAITPSVESYINAFYEQFYNDMKQYADLQTKFDAYRTCIREQAVNSDSILKVVLNIMKSVSANN